MRFVLGPIPPSRALDAEEQGWTMVAELSSKAFALIALFPALVFLLPAIFLVLELAEKNQEQLRSPLFLAALALLLPVDELVHALAYFKGLRSPHLIMGFWPSRGMCYAILDSPMPRNRVLLVSAAPFVVLSVIPGISLPLLDNPQRTLVLIVVLVHTALCLGDFMVFLSILRAWVHNNGWKTYWSLVEVGTTIDDQE